MRVAGPSIFFKAFVCLTTVCCHGKMISESMEREQSSSLRGTLSTSTTDARPIMYTFFDALPTEASGYSAGMSTKAHDSMISVWQEAWQQAGWQTKVLTMDDARKHPEFGIFDAKIATFSMSKYDKLCYYRWVAMAAVGGGWMSDYDTLPLHNFTQQGLDLPMHGSFTVYQAHVPSLLSGSANEWLRLSKRLVEYASKHKMENGETHSDMLALLEMQKRYPDMMIHRDDVAGVYAIPENDKWTQSLCEQLTPQHMRAMHFSHFFISKFWLPGHPDNTLQDRPQIARLWLDNWLKGCGRKPFRQW